MRVKVVSGFIHNRRALAIGEEIDVSDSEARRLIAQQRAAAVDAPKPAPAGATIANKEGTAADAKAGKGATPVTPPAKP